MSQVELGLLGASSFLKLSALRGLLGETWTSRAAVQMVPVPVIGVSWLTAGGRVIVSESPCPRSNELVELEPEPVAVVVELALV